MSGRQRRLESDSDSADADLDGDNNNSNSNTNENRASPKIGSKRSSDDSSFEPNRKRRRISRNNNNSNNSNNDVIAISDEESENDLIVTQNNNNNNNNNNNTNNNRNNNRRSNIRVRFSRRRSNNDNNNNNNNKNNNNNNNNGDISDSDSVLDIENNPVAREKYKAKQLEKEARREEIRNNKQWCSGAQSPQKRMRLRSEYRQLADETVNKRAEIIDPTTDVFQTMLNKQENLFADVQETTEAHMDIEQSVRMSEMLKGETNKLANENFTISCKDVIKAIIRKFKIENNGMRDIEQHGHEIDWSRFGASQFSGHTRLIITGPELKNTLNNGAIENAWQLDEKEIKKVEKMEHNRENEAEIAEKKRKMKEKRANKWKTTEEQKTAQVITLEDAKSHKNKTETKSRVKALNKLLKKKCNPDKAKNSKNKKNKESKEIAMFPFLVNPESYSETIENFFDLSFMAKEGTAMIVPSQNEVNGISSQPMVKYMDKLNEKKNQINNGQCIVKLDYQIYTNLIDNFNITESQVKRKHKKHKKHGNGGASGGSGASGSDEDLDMNMNDSDTESENNDINNNINDDNGDEHGSDSEGDEKMSVSRRSQKSQKSQKSQQKQRGNRRRINNSNKKKSGGKSDKREIDDSDEESDDE